MIQADPVVFKAWYQRELKRRKERTSAEGTENEEEEPSSATTADQQHEQKQKHSAELDAALTSWEDIDVSSSSSKLPDPTSKKSTPPLWKFLPHSRYDENCIANWIAGR